MTAQGIKTLWDISEWENEEPASWVAWKLPECPKDLKNEKRMLFSHLSGLAPLGKNIKDKRGWGMSSGKYTAAEGYQNFTANYNVPGNPEIWNYLWNCRTIPKIEMFSWTLMHGRVLTGENLEKMGIAGPFCCPLCAVDAENISHVF